MSPQDETRALNEAFFEILSRQPPEGAADAVNAYTRSQMYHRFTGMPKRGLFRQILPSVPVFTAEEMAARGWPCAPDFVVFEGRRLYAHLHEGGEVFYEVAEARLEEEDFERRLAERRVARWQWEAHWGLVRLRKKSPQAVASRAYFYDLVGVVVRQALDLACRNHHPEGTP